MYQPHRRSSRITFNFPGIVSDKSKQNQEDNDQIASKNADNRQPTRGTGADRLEKPGFLFYDADFLLHQVFGRSVKGFDPHFPEKVNQDGYVIAHHVPTETLIFGVFDGHGRDGHLVSKFFTDRLPNAIVMNERFNVNPGQAVVDALEYIERLLYADRSINIEFSGSTGLVGTLRKDVLTLANIGDSRVILGRDPVDERFDRRYLESAKIQAVRLTSDHKPDRKSEQKRIEEAGGRVFPISYADGEKGPLRVWLKHQDIPGLAMSRSLGDSVARTAGVISRPECHRIELSVYDKIIVWATDGLWEFCSNQEVIDIASSCNTAEEAVKKLTEVATARWMDEERIVDDITIIVIFRKDFNRPRRPCGELPVKKDKHSPGLLAIPQFK